MRIFRVTVVVLTFFLVLSGCENFLDNMTHNIFSEFDKTPVPDAEELNETKENDPDEFVSVILGILDRRGFTGNELPDGVTQDSVLDQLADIYSNPELAPEIRRKSALGAAAVATRGDIRTVAVINGFSDLIVDAVSGDLNDPTPGSIILGLFGTERVQSDVEESLADLMQAAAAYDYYLDTGNGDLPADDLQPALISLMIADIVVENGEAAVVSAITEGDFSGLVIDGTILSEPEAYNGNANLAAIVTGVNLPQFLGN